MNTNLHAVVAEIVRRVPAMADDSAVNNEQLITNLLNEFMDQNQNRNGRGLQAPRVSYESKEIIGATKSIVSERKTIVISRRQNAQGEFLRIDETRGNRHSAVIVPGDAINEFIEELEEMFPENAV